MVETEFLDESLIDGGIGLKTWAPEMGTATLIVRNITVEEIISDEEIVDTEN